MRRVRPSRPTRGVAVLLLGLCLSCASRGVDSGQPLPPWLDGWQAWREAREAELSDPQAYLGLSGLIWLEPGLWNLGADPGADLLLPPSCGDRVGQLTVSGGTVSLVASPGAVTDAAGRPVKTLRLREPGQAAGPEVRAGEVTLHVIERGGRLALRVADPASPVLAAYDETPAWPPRERWRVPACYVPEDEPQALAIPNVLGGHYEGQRHGRLIFELAGASHELQVTGRGADGLTVLFGDATNGRGSYAGGRTLLVPWDGSAQNVWLDFNRAENLPCAYSPYTTCPMPPEGNVLPVAVTAGEMAWHGREELGPTPLPD